MDPGRIVMPPPLPREHGVWAMLAIPLVLGLAAAWPPAAAAWLLVPAVVLLFLSRDAAASAAERLLDGRKTPAGYIGRRMIWGFLEACVAVLLVAASWTVAAPGARGRLLGAAAITLVLAGVHTLLVLADRDRSVPGELIGMAGLASAAPLLVAASGRPLDRRALGAGLIAWLYFATSLAYVKAVRGLWKNDRRARRRCVAAHAAVAGALASLVAGACITLPLASAFVPVYTRTAWGLRHPPANLRVLGWREAGVATGFGLIAIAALAFTA